MQSAVTIDITSTVRRAPFARNDLRVPFEEMARKILQPQYELSLVLCSNALARSLNRTYRKRDYIPNILSFPLAKNEGEIFLNVRKAEREAPYYNRVVVRGKRRMLSRIERRRMAEKHIARLFVHGCLHLKGLKHGKHMDTAEKRILKDSKML